jgi:hypothetical protein
MVRSVLKTRHVIKLVSLVSQPAAVLLRTQGDDNLIICAVL